MNPYQPIVDETWTTEDYEKQFKKERAQRKRKVRAYNKPTYKCEFCSAQYKSTQEVLDHMFSTHIHT